MFINSSIRRQIWISFITLAGLFVVTLGVVGVLLSQLTQDVRHINEATLPQVLMADQMNLNRSEVQQFLTDVSATHDRAGYQEAQAAAAQFQQGVDMFKQLYQRRARRPSCSKCKRWRWSSSSFMPLGRPWLRPTLRTGARRAIC